MNAVVMQHVLCASPDTDLKHHVPLYAAILRCLQSTWVHSWEMTGHQRS